MFNFILYNIVNKHLEDFVHFLSAGRAASLCARFLRCSGNAVDWSFDFEGPQQDVTCRWEYRFLCLLVLHNKLPVNNF